MVSGAAGVAQVGGASVLIMSLTPLCSSRSFFQPTKEGKAKKPEKETANSIREKEPPPKYVRGPGQGICL